MAVEHKDNFLVIFVQDVHAEEGEGIEVYLNNGRIAKLRIKSTSYNCGPRDKVVNVLDSQ